MALSPLFQKVAAQAEQEQAAKFDPIFQKLNKAPEVEEDAPMGTAFDQLLEGGAWGFSDELAGIGTMIGSALGGNQADVPYGDLYTRGRDQVRERNKAYSDENPWTALGLQAAGAIPGGVGAGAKFVGTKLANSMSNAARNLFMGSTGGMTAAAGMSDADSLRGMVGDTVKGGFLGAGTAGILPPVTNAVNSGVQYAAGAVRDSLAGPSSRANREVRRALEDGGITNRAQLYGAVDEIDNPLLADVSESTRNLTDILAQEPGPSRDIIKPVLEQRKRQSGQNIVQGLEETTGKRAGYYQSLDEIEAAKVALSKKPYEEAMDVNVPFDGKLESIFKRDRIKEAFKTAQRLANDRGREVPQLFEMVDGEMVSRGGVPDMRGWQTIKEGLDTMIEKETDTLTEKLSPEGRSIFLLQKELLRELDRVNPAYKAARKIYSGGSSLQDAMRKGSKVLLDDDYVSKKAFDGMSDADKEGYLLGAMNSIRNKVELGSENADMSLRQMFTSPAMKRRLKTAFPTEDGYKEFMRIVDSERIKGEMNKRIYGSQTHSRQQQRDSLGLDAAGNAAGAATGNIWSMLRLAGNAGDKMRRLPVEAQTQMSNMLTSPVSQLPTKVLSNSGVETPTLVEFLLRNRRPNQSTYAPLLGYGGGYGADQY